MMSSSRDEHPLRQDPRDPDRRSIRVALVAEMLRLGRAPGYVADATGVPFALVEWIDEQQHRHPPEPPSHLRPAHGADCGASERAGARKANDVSWLRARWRVRAAAAIVVACLTAWVLAAFAVVHRQPVAGAAAAALSALVLGVNAAVLITHRQRRRPCR